MTGRVTDFTDWEALYKKLDSEEEESLPNAAEIVEKAEAVIKKKADEAKDARKAAEAAEKARKKAKDDAFKKPVDEEEIAQFDDDDRKSPYGFGELEGDFKPLVGGSKKTRKKSNIFRKNKISRKYIMLKQCGGSKAKSGSKSNPYSSMRKASRSRRRVCYYKKKGRTLKMKKKKKKSRKRRR